MSALDGLPAWVSTQPVKQRSFFCVRQWLNSWGADWRMLGRVFATPNDSVTVLKDDATTTVLAVLDPNEAAHPLVIKRYNARSAWHVVSRAVRPTRAARCWRMSYAFAQAGIPVAAPIFMQEHRFGPLRGVAYFASQRVIGQELIKVFAELDTAQKNSVAEQVRALFERMERHCLSHGDLKASNLIWDKEQLWVIDLDAAQAHKSRFFWRSAHAKDKRRFKRNWQAQPELAQYFDFL